MEKTFTITLGNGTVLEELRLNGNNYISKTELTAEMFTSEALAEVTIDDGEIVKVIEDAVLIQAIQCMGEYWFIIAEKSAEQKEKEALQAKANRAEAVTDYNIMMGILEDPDEDEEE